MHNQKYQSFFNKSQNFTINGSTNDIERRKLQIIFAQCRQCVIQSHKQQRYVVQVDFPQIKSPHELELLALLCKADLVKITMCGVLIEWSSYLFGFWNHMYLKCNYCFWKQNRRDQWHSSQELSYPILCNYIPLKTGCEIEFKKMFLYTKLHGFFHQKNWTDKHWEFYIITLYYTV